MVYAIYVCNVFEMKMNALVIFAKFPEPGRVKKVLGKEIGMENSAKVCAAFIKDLISEHEERDYDLYLSFIGQENKEKYRNLFPNAILYVQRGTNLGENMFYTFEDLLDDYEKIVVIGADVPDLHADYVQNALSELDNYDVIIGPADDGGYCLIALKESVNIFTEVPWGSSELLKHQIDKIRDRNLTFFQLNSLPDVDEIEELIVLKKNLKREDAKNTYDLLQSLDV